MMLTKTYITAICLIGCFIVTNSQTTKDSVSIEDELSNPCTKLKTCGECIRKSFKCSWCAQEKYPRKVPRCDIKYNLLDNCDPKAITDPSPSAKEDENADYTSGNDTAPPVQVKPQSLEIKILPNDPVKFPIRFRQQANYPVDLYFLLDVSYGMVRQKKAQERLIKLGKDIPSIMKNITNNFKLGFGTFVDKRLMPYTAWTERMLKNRCPREDKNCRKPHDFINQMKLGNTDFDTKMENALKDISQSMDDTEGGFDGLIQALACGSLIGWRETSRKIIVYSSNSLFHLAGNGKLGGATKQSDLQCYLDSKGMYTKETVYDYPSVSQIASKLKEQSANVIFAVMKKFAPQYNLLSSYLDGAVVGELEDNSKNIVELIRDKYYELRSKVQFKPNVTDYVDIKMRSKCLGTVPRETNTCEDLEIGQEVEFEVKLTVNDSICDGSQSFVRKPVAIEAVGLNEKIELSLVVQCDCDCELKENSIENHKNCTSAGSLQCGICACNEGRYGEVCQCDESQISSKESFELCKENNETETCSGKGECVCGRCFCYAISEDKQDEKYSGDYCECNEYSCPVGQNNLLCAGRGGCDCDGKCMCSPEWSGPSCECPTSKDTCLAQNNLICNGNGTCVCGKCQCNKGSGLAGPTCEDCTNCDAQCSRYVDCAQCTVFKTGRYNREECAQKCTNVIEAERKSGPGIRDCFGFDVDGCKFYFTYEYTATNDALVKVQKAKECEEPAPVAAIIGGTVAAVVLIPLLIICLIIFWRNHRDKKEYAEFMKEREKARWESGANPIYKNPNSTFQNPTYMGGKK